MEFVLSLLYRCPNLLSELLCEFVWCCCWRQQTENERRGWHQRRQQPRGWPLLLGQPIWGHELFRWPQIPSLQTKGHNPANWQHLRSPELLMWAVNHSLCINPHPLVVLLHKAVCFPSRCLYTTTVVWSLRCSFFKFCLLINFICNCSAIVLSWPAVTFFYTKAFKNH